MSHRLILSYSVTNLRPFLRLRSNFLLAVLACENYVLRIYSADPVDTQHPGELAKLPEVVLMSQGVALPYAPVLHWSGWMCSTWSCDISDSLCGAESDPHPCRIVGTRHELRDIPRGTIPGFQLSTSCKCAAVLNMSIFVQVVLHGLTHCTLWTLSCSLTSVFCASISRCCFRFINVSRCSSLFSNGPQMLVEFHRVSSEDISWPMTACEVLQSPLHQLIELCTQSSPDTFHL